MGHCYQQLQEWERSEINRLLCLGISRAEIGRRLGRDRSTVHREIERNARPRAGPRIERRGRPCAVYQPTSAERRAQRLRHARRGTKIGRLSQLGEHIRDHLAMGRSPEQIAGRLRREKGRAVISHESIYRFIYSRIGRIEKLHNHLAQSKSRRGRRARLGQSKPLIPNRISIHERPPEIKRDLAFGHWEADLMHFGRTGLSALVLTEQNSRFLLAMPQHGKKSLTTAANIKRLLDPLPAVATASLTFDNGGEFAAHRSLGVSTYFCDPHSPWQKGAIENAIGRLRRSPLQPDKFQSDDTFDEIVARHNNTPRKCLDFRTPTEAFLNQIQTSVALDL
jgi:IS30 family transposase